MKAVIYAKGTVQCAVVGGVIGSLFDGHGNPAMFAMIGAT